MRILRASENGLVKGMILAAAGSTLFAFKPILIKLIYLHGLDTTTILTWRMIFSLPCYLAVGFWILCIARTKSGASDLPVSNVFLFAGALGVLGYYAAAYGDLYGLQFVSAQLGRMILFTYPALVTLLGWWLLGSQVTKTTILALLISYVGIALIFIHDLNYYGSNVWWGSTWIFFSAVSFSLFMVYSKGLIEKLGSGLFTCVAMSAASVAIILHYFVSRFVLSDIGWSDGIPGAEPMLKIFILAMFSTVIPSFFIAAAVKQIGSSMTSIVGSIGPVVTAGFAVSLLGEPFTLFHGVGMVLVVVAITLSGLNKARKAVN